MKQGQHNNNNNNKTNFLTDVYRFYLQGAQYNAADSGNINPLGFRNFSRANITESNIPSWNK